MQLCPYCPLSLVPGTAWALCIQVIASMSAPMLSSAVTHCSTKLGLRLVCGKAQSAERDSGHHEPARLPARLVLGDSRVTRRTNLSSNF